MGILFKSMLRSEGIPYKVYRSGTLICEVEGVTQIDSVDFQVGTDIEKGDVIVNPENERLYVSDKETIFVNKMAEYITAHTLSETDHNRIQTLITPVFNIENVNNSIVGTQNSATIYNGTSIEDLRELINQHSSLDKELLEDMIDLLEKVLSSGEPVKKGLFSKFADVLQKNEWLTSPLAAFILERFFLQ